MSPDPSVSCPWCGSANVFVQIEKLQMTPESNQCFGLIRCNKCGKEWIDVPDKNNVIRVAG